MTAINDSTATTIEGVTEQHRALAPFVGTFTAVVSFWMGPGEPHISTGVMVNEWELGGRFLRQTYAADATDGPYPVFEGRGYWGYNTTTERYEGFWIDIASTGMMIETGSHDLAKHCWTMQGTFHHPETGEPLTKRSVYTVLSGDEHLMESFMPGPGGEDMKVMEIRFTRSA